MRANLLQETTDHVRENETIQLFPSGRPAVCGSACASFSHILQGATDDLTSRRQVPTAFHHDVQAGFIVQDHQMHLQ